MRPFLDQLSASQQKLADVLAAEQKFVNRLCKDNVAYFLNQEIERLKERIDEVKRGPVELGATEAKELACLA